MLIATDNFMTPYNYILPMSAVGAVVGGFPIPILFLHPTLPSVTVCMRLQVGTVIAVFYAFVPETCSI